MSHNDADQDGTGDSTSALRADLLGESDASTAVARESGVWGVKAVASGSALLVVILAVLASATGLARSSGDPGTGGHAVELLRPAVLAEMPHDRTAFTEGLEIDGPALYEATGQVGHSSLRELDPATGELRRVVPIPDGFFGEGIAVVGDKIWQLTWRNAVAVEWDKATFALLRQVPMDGEGWGLCRDGDRLVRSDGTAKLRFHDPDSFRETGSVAVTRAGQPLGGLNALECVDGQVWANVSPTDQIVRIDPATGFVTALVDASGLLDPGQAASASVLNGIAYAGGGEFLLTGKYWPTMYRVNFVPQA